MSEVGRAQASVSEHHNQAQDTQDEAQSRPAASSGENAICAAADSSKFPTEFEETAENQLLDVPDHQSNSSVSVAADSSKPVDETNSRPTDDEILRQENEIRRANILDGFVSDLHI